MRGLSSLFLGCQLREFFKRLNPALERALLSQAAIVEDDLLAIIRDGRFDHFGLDRSSAGTRSDFRD